MNGSNLTLSGFETLNLKSTVINQPDLTDKYRTFHSTTEYKSFQVHMGHSPGEIPC